MISFILGHTLVSSFPYVLLLKDADLILKLKTDKLREIINIMEQRQIDKVSLGVFHPTKSGLVGTGALTLCKINNCINDEVSLYKRVKLKQLYDQFPNANFNEMREYVTNNWVIYGIYKTASIQIVYHRGFAYCEYFSFLHITQNGKLLPLFFYYDLQDKLLRIIHTYRLDIEVDQSAKFIYKNVLCQYR
jgi:hypothetical protein